MCIDQHSYNCFYLNQLETIISYHKVECIWLYLYRYRGLFLGVYAALGFGQALFVLVAAFSLAFGAFRASRTLHEQLIHSIMRSPMSFFDTTPLGRILNRFSKDIFTIDQTLPWTFRYIDWQVYIFILSVHDVVNLNIVYRCNHSSQLY